MMETAEFEARIAAIIPEASPKAMDKWLLYADDMRNDGITDSLLRDVIIALDLTTKNHGSDIAQKIFNLGETFTLNDFEIQGAARLLRQGVSIEEIPQKALDGLCDESNMELQNRLAAKSAWEQEAPEIPPALETSLSPDGSEQLNARLDINLADYHEHLLGFAPQELIDMAPRIAMMGEVHDYLKDRGFTEHETAYLLQFEKPLEIIVDAWEAYRTDLGDIDYIVWGVCDRQEALGDGYTLATNAPISDRATERESFRDALKPSIRQKLRDAQEKAKIQASAPKSHDHSKNDPII